MTARDRTGAAALMGAAITGLIAFALFLAGGLLLWANGHYKDADGYLSTGSARFASHGHALTTPSLEDRRRRARLPAQGRPLRHDPPRRDLERAQAAVHRRRPHPRRRRLPARCLAERDLRHRLRAGPRPLRAASGHTQSSSARRAVHLGGERRAHAELERPARRLVGRGHERRRLTRRLRRRQRRREGPLHRGVRLWGARRRAAVHHRHGRAHGLRLAPRGAPTRRRLAREGADDLLPPRALAGAVAFASRRRANACSSPDGPTASSGPETPKRPSSSSDERAGLVAAGAQLLDHLVGRHDLGALRVAVAVLPRADRCDRRAAARAPARALLEADRPGPPARASARGTRPRPPGARACAAGRLPRSPSSRVAGSPARRARSRSAAPRAAARARARGAPTIASSVAHRELHRLGAQPVEQYRLDQRRGDRRLVGGHAEPARHRLDRQCPARPSRAARRRTPP